MIKASIKQLNITKMFNNKKRNIFFRKKVLITGHTGFKGSWLSLWMHMLGANVLGISKDIPTKPSHYKSAGLDKLVKSKFVDIQDLKKIKNYKKLRGRFYISSCGSIFSEKILFREPNDLEV